MSHRTPAADAPFVLVPQYFGCTVFDRGTSRYLPFDAEATALLRRAADTPFFALPDTIAEPERREQTWAFLRHCYGLGMFRLDGRFAGAILEQMPPPDHLSGPLAVHLEVVAACNLACAHCFAGALPRRERPLTLAELDRLFADMAGMGSFRLGLTGGEPLLRRDLFEIIDMAAAHGLHPCVTTNGLLITEEIARAFGARRLVWLNVSLDGASPATNDPVRGAGTFARVLERLALLGRHTPFTLAFTITRGNAAEVRACAELAEQVGAAAAVFRPLYPVGTAARHLDALMPTFEQYHGALLSLSAEADDLRVIDPFSPLLRAEGQAVTQPNYGCGAGSTVCSISVSGTVSPCSFLGDGFAAASLREQPLPAIWHAGQTFRDMRGLPGGTPDTFSGGCRARALALAGSANAPDPWMQARQAAAASRPLTFYEPAAILDLARRGPEAR